MFGRSLITGLARLNGRPVALMASDPHSYGGSWTADTCQKAVRFMDLAETFHLPVVYLEDCPGFMIGWRPNVPPPSGTACAQWRR
jgi:acetyl-CoA carboxylase carboxyltransferase component